MNRVQQPVILGKCYQCRQNETNDKNHNYTLITAKRPDGKIHIHAKLCSVHLKELEDTGLYSITKHKVVN
jgi:hypothetical protein